MSSQGNTAKILPFPISCRAKPKTIVVGDVVRWKAQGRSIPPIDGVKVIPISALDQKSIAEIAPETILSPLIADTFDALDVAERLHDFGYLGRYCALSETLPNRHAVIQEVNSHAPSVWFDILMMPA